MQHMKDALKKAMAKKEQKELSPVEKKARMGVVEGLRKVADEEIKSRGLKKVTVASDSMEGLKKGLDVAKDKMEDLKEHGNPEGDMSDVSESEEEAMVDDAEDGEDREHDVFSGSAEEQEEALSEEEIEDKLRKLMAQKEALKARKKMK